MKLIKSNLLFLIYPFIFFGVLFLFDLLFFPHILDDVNFINWDAQHYQSIKNDGYYNNLVAFFPLLPEIWKFLGIGIYEISFFNLILFYISFFFLNKYLKLPTKELLAYLTIPSFIFFNLPYSESLFFFSSTLIIVGFKKNHSVLICLGLFIASLSRPAFTMFIPAIIITEIFGSKTTISYKNILLYITSSLTGVALVFWKQFSDTKIWFGFFEAQKSWGNELRLPSFPLTSWAGGFIVRLDAMAFLIGILFGFFLLIYLIRFHKKKKMTIPKEVLFSMAYLGGMSVTVLLYRGGSLFSLNRFLLATPFIIIAFNYWINHKISFTFKQLSVILILINLFWFFFNSYNHIQITLLFFAISLYMLLLFSIKALNDSLKKISFYALIITNFIFQIILMIRFLSNEWVG